MTKQRRTFTPEFKHEAASLVLDLGYSHTDIGRCLMQRYNWQRPHQFNGGLAPAVAEEKLNAVSGIS